jgi:hypothetical protein
MRRMPVVALAVLAARGCPPRAEPVQVRSEPSASAVPPVSPAPPRLPITRLRGDIEGRFSVRRTRVVAGEPIVVDLEIRSPLAVAFGGDVLNLAGFPTRVAVKATDAAGAAVCDSVGKPVLVSMGGPGGDRALAAGETYRESFVLNPSCPALGSPGDYHVTLHRRLTNGSMRVKDPASPLPSPCDVFPVHEGPLPAGRAPLCAELVDAAPSVTTELDLHVEPFDAAALRAQTAARLAEASSATPRDDIGRQSLAIWICGWLTCACHAACGCPNAVPSIVAVADADLAGILPAALPASFPASCPPRANQNWK